MLLWDVVDPSLISITPRSGFVRVLENLESPGKRLVALESFGNLFNSSKKIWNVWQTVRRIKIEILGVKGLMWTLECWKNQSESWKSSGNLFLKKGTYPALRKLLEITCSLMYTHDYNASIRVPNTTMVIFYITSFNSASVRELCFSKCSWYTSIRLLVVLEDEQKSRAFFCSGVKLFSRYCSRSSLGKSMLGRPLHPVKLNNRLCNELLLPPRTTIIWWALCNKHSSWVGILNNEDARVRIYKTLSQWRVTRYPVPFSLSWNRSLTRFNTNSMLCRRLLFKESISSRHRANYE